jgi:hypothetical protein
LACQALLPLVGEVDGNLLARVSPSPNGNGLLALQDHVVAKDVRHSQFSNRFGRENGQAYQ